MKNHIPNSLNGGQAMIVATILFLVVSITIIFGLAGPILKQQRMTSQTLLSRQSYFLAEAGVENVVYKLKTGKPVAPTEILSLDGNTTTIVTTDTPLGKEIISTADVKSSVRKLRTNVVLGSGASFHYGVQAGDGGIIMENTSSILGNVYSNGPVRGSGPLNNIIDGNVISGGPNGLIDNLYASTSAYAHTIRNSTVKSDAYYQTISNTSVLGASYPESPDQATSTLGISDEQIEEWKQVALDGGVISSPCPYKITGARTLGPIKINCNLEISGNNYTLTLNGNVWVKGDIDILNSPTIRVNPSFGDKGVVIIADEPLDPYDGAEIELQNSTVFEGSGSPGSHVMLISQNRAAEAGVGSDVAINVKNTVSGDLLVYAGHGEITLQNNITLKEVAAYRIRLKNTAKVIYETGLVNLLFDSGPSGGYEVLDWREIE